MELARFERKFREVDDLVLHLKGRVLVRALLQERGRNIGTKSSATGRLSWSTRVPLRTGCRIRRGMICALLVSSQQRCFPASAYRWIPFRCSSHPDYHARSIDTATHEVRQEADLALPHPIHVDQDAQFPITARSQVR
jgi:hypothetical protein